MKYMFEAVFSIWSLSRTCNKDQSGFGSRNLAVDCRELNSKHRRFELAVKDVFSRAVRRRYKAMAIKSIILVVLNCMLAKVLQLFV
jgi:hypothetical protein